MNETWQDYCDAYAYLSGKAFDNAPGEIRVKALLEDGYAIVNVRKLTRAEYEQLNAQAKKLRAQLYELDDPNNDDQRASFETIAGELAPLHIRLLINAQ